MKFGQVKDPSAIDFRLPETAPETYKVLTGDGDFEVRVGCAKWNKTDLKNFYPRGTKDELGYYATQFNSIEMNATFYNSPIPEQVMTWKSKVGSDFRFFPKIPMSISHYSRLKSVEPKVREFCSAISGFGDNLGTSFLQLKDDFAPNQLRLLEEFIHQFPEDIPLAVEVRHPDWFKDEAADQLYRLLVQTGTTNVLVDTAGRRDMLHMRLSTPSAFIRYVGANHPTDYKRLDDWLEVIAEWRKAGLRQLNFFVHQNIEKESPLLSAYLIRELNERFGLKLTIPHLLNVQQTLL